MLGTLINYGGMRRVNTRGLAGAAKCMIMATVAYNLKKLLKHRVPKAQAAVVGLKKSSEGLKRHVFKCLHAIALYGAGYKRLALS